MHDDGDARHGAARELDGQGVDGGADPRADGGVPGLVHGQVVGARGEEGGGRVEAPVVEEGVDGDEEEGGEGGEEGVGLVAV